MRKKGQAAFEYMSIIGIALIILLGLVAFAYYWTASSKEGMYLSVAENTVNNIVESANLVYAQGYPAKTTIIVQVPENVDSALIDSNRVWIRLRVAGGYSDVSASAKANMSGELPVNPGYYKIQIQSMGNWVNVSRTE